jgi:hypothetical protein
MKVAQLFEELKAYTGGRLSKTLENAMLEFCDAFDIDSFSVSTEKFHQPHPTKGWSDTVNVKNFFINMGTEKNATLLKRYLKDKGFGVEDRYRPEHVVNTWNVPKKFKSK